MLKLSQCHTIAWAMPLSHPLWKCSLRLWIGKTWWPLFILYLAKSFSWWRLLFVCCVCLLGMTLSKENGSGVSIACSLVVVTTPLHLTGVDSIVSTWRPFVWLELSLLAWFDFWLPGKICVSECFPEMRCGVNIGVSQFSTTSRQILIGSFLMISVCWIVNIDKKS